MCSSQNIEMSEDREYVAQTVDFGCPIGVCGGSVRVFTSRTSFRRHLVTVHGVDAEYVPGRPGQLASNKIFVLSPSEVVKRKAVYKRGQVHVKRRKCERAERSTNEPARIQRVRATIPDSVLGDDLICEATPAQDVSVRQLDVVLGEYAAGDLSSSDLFSPSSFFGNVDFSIELGVADAVPDGEWNSSRYPTFMELLEYELPESDVGVLRQTFLGGDNSPSIETSDSPENLGGVNSPAKVQEDSTQATTLAELIGSCIDLDTDEYTAAAMEIPEEPQNLEFASSPALSKDPLKGDVPSCTTSPLLQERGTTLMPDVVASTVVTLMQAYPMANATQLAEWSSRSLGLSMDATPDDILLLDSVIYSVVLAERFSASRQLSLASIAAQNDPFPAASGAFQVVYADIALRASRPLGRAKAYARFSQPLNLPALDYGIDVEDY